MNPVDMDAARYRWLRANFADFIENQSTVPDGSTGDYFDRYLTADELDAEIDKRR